MGRPELSFPPAGEGGGGKAEEGPEDAGARLGNRVWNAKWIIGRAKLQIDYQKRSATSLPGCIAAQESHGVCHLKRDESGARGIRPSRRYGGRVSISHRPIKRGEYWQEIIGTG